MLKQIRKFIGRTAVLLALPFMMTAVQSGAADYQCSADAWLRSEPDSTVANQIGLVHRDEVVSLMEEEYGWGRVEYISPQTGSTLVGWTAMYLYEPVEYAETVSVPEYTAVPADRTIFTFLTEQLGFNTAQAKAVMTNLYAESRYNPTESVIDTNGLTSYGICQWNGERFECLKSFCNDRGLDDSAVSSQLAFLAYELNNTHYVQYDVMKSFPDTAQGCYDAAYYWAENFEVCSSAYWTERAESAFVYYSNS